MIHSKVRIFISYCKVTHALKYLVCGDLGKVTNVAVQKPDTSLALFAGISN